MKVKTTGIQVKIIAWVGSGGVGLSRIWRNMVTPMISGQMPIISRLGGVQGISPNNVNSDVGSGADRSWIQPKKGACRISMVMNRTL